MSKPPRKFTHEPAKRVQVPLMVGIMSPSGGGKTYSALRLATGMQEVMGGDIYGIDTENNRMLHYADKFKFQHVPFTPPFGSIDYLEAIKYCTAKGARVIIVDGLSQEHIGEGGYLETAESTVTRIVQNMEGGDTYKNRDKVKMLGWATAGPLRQKMIEGLKQLNGCFVFCFRAKEKTKPVKVKDKTEIIDMGFMPIAGDEWVYEMAVNCMLEPRSGGVPTWRSDHVGERMMMKLPIQFKEIFAEPNPLDEAIGRQLAAWALGDAGSSNPERTEQPKGAVEQPTGGGTSNSDLLAELERSLRAAAGKGTVALMDEWKTLHPKHQKHFNALKERHLKADALAADKKPPTDEEISA